MKKGSIDTGKVPKSDFWRVLFFGSIFAVLLNVGTDFPVFGKKGCQKSEFESFQELYNWTNVN